MLFTPTSLIEFQHRFADEAACAASTLRDALARWICVSAMREL